MTTPNSIIGFQLQRIQCGLAYAPAIDIREYGATYELNNNPVLTTITMQTSSAAPVEAPATPLASAPIPVASGTTLTLTAHWSDASVEIYPAWDVINLVLAKYTESMRVSWYATSGSFEHDTTGVAGTETETFDDVNVLWQPTGAGTTAPQTSTENTWTPDTSGPVHVWLVLHDSRGGTDFAAFDLQVSP
jgi:hypothetical protein